ncbi:MAG TPA: membrane protein insertase YidC [Candidatus Sulfotelmatobacter sp.]|nr:membrane protein insertase YidC [Candidatus Sulfotelmatobacter sp.]
MADFQNPQQEPGSEKRLVLVFILTFLVILAFQPLLKKYGPQPTAPQSANQAAQTQSSSSSSSSSTSAPAAPNLPAVPVPVGAAKQASSEAETVVENDLYKITFTNRGAQVKSWILKKFDNETQNGPLDLVNPTASAQYGYPLSLWTYDEGLRGRLSSALYVASREGAQTSPTDVTFEYSDQELAVHKTFRFDHSYVVSVETSVVYKGAAVAALPAWPAGFGDQVTPVGYAAGLIDYHSDASTDRTALVFPNFVLRVPYKSVIGGNTLKVPFEWAGPVDQYFAAIFMPDDPGATSMVTLRNSLQIPQKPGASETARVDVLGAAVGNLRGPTVERVYVGPKELSLLETTFVPTIKNDHPDLRGLVDFGWWGIIAKPLFLWLRWTYSHVVPNWGWAIVLQTIIINVVLLPLRITQMKSMLKMQRVAPQIKSIQDKYKKYSLRDPRKAGMNEEISGLYKKEGVNPAGGCLPMLIQFPFLIAYYRMLGTALDLRHAHWLWIPDLSARDPYYLLPIIMVISMFAMQRITPQPAGMDPAQQKMMMWMMPLMMGFFFFNFASGLSLYYAESNLIQMAQQAIMNKTKLGQEMREMLEKRARKKEK